MNGDTYIDLDVTFDTDGQLLTVFIELYDCAFTNAEWRVVKDLTKKHGRWKIETNNLYEFQTTISRKFKIVDRQSLYRALNKGHDLALAIGGAMNVDIPEQQREFKPGQYIIDFPHVYMVTYHANSKNHSYVIGEDASGIFLRLPMTATVTFADVCAKLTQMTEEVERLAAV